MKNNFAIIISNTSRSFEYLKCLKKNKFTPKYIVYIDDGSKNNISNILKSQKFFFKDTIIKKFKTKEIDNRISNFIFSINTKNIIYSGYPGVIIKNSKLLKNKNLIHSHPGKIPEYKGSTTIYYSILKEKKIYCSTFILNDKLDSGKVLLVKKYPIPKDIKHINGKYDDKIRSLNMLKVLSGLNSRPKISQKKSNPYYVIHPLLRAIVFKQNK